MSVDESEAQRAWSEAWARMLQYEEASRVEGDAARRVRLLDRWRMAAAELSEIEAEWGPIGPIELARRAARGERADVSVAEPGRGEEDRARA